MCIVESANSHMPSSELFCISAISARAEWRRDGIVNITELGIEGKILKLVNNYLSFCVLDNCNTVEAFIPWYTLCIANTTIRRKHHSRIHEWKSTGNLAKKNLYSWECWLLNLSDLKVVCSDILYTVSYKLFNSIKHNANKLLLFICSCYISCFHFSWF